MWVASVNIALFSAIGIVSATYVSRHVLIGPRHAGSVMPGWPSASESTKSVLTQLPWQSIVEPVRILCGGSASGPPRTGFKPGAGVVATMVLTAAGGNVVARRVASGVVGVAILQISSFS